MGLQKQIAMVEVLVNEAEQTIATSHSLKRGTQKKLPLLCYLRILCVSITVIPLDDEDLQDVDEEDDDFSETQRRPQLLEMRYV
jgi:hypothetical protein